MDTNKSQTSDTGHPGQSEGSGFISGGMNRSGFFATLRMTGMMEFSSPSHQFA
jgi:hypothetical protein